MTIEVLNVSKNYDGKPYLKSVSLDISSGSVISVIGPKKSGKTALLRIILGLEEADEGKITLLGDYKYDRVNAGVVFQDDRLCPGFTAAENVALVNEKLSVRVAREELNKLLPEGVCDLPVEELTPGQRRTVCIVRAMCVPSDVRLMDEPFAGMSTKEKEKALTYIRSVIANTPLVVTCLPGEELPFGRTCPLT